MRYGHLASMSMVYIDKSGFILESPEEIHPLHSQIGVYKHENKTANRQKTNRVKNQIKQQPPPKVRLLSVC